MAVDTVNLTFFKNYAVSQTNINADSSVGSATGTATASRSAVAPATYFNTAGVMQTLITANVGRFTQGMYDQFGYHPRRGVWVERTAATNQLVQSSGFTDVAWTATNLTVADGVTDPGITPTPVGGTVSTVSTLTAGATDATLTQAFTDAVAGKYYAAIFVMRKTGSGAISLRANTGDAYTVLTPFVRSDRWTRISVISSSATNPTFDLKLSVSGDALYVCCADLVKLGHITSHVPTTTVALTRSSEIARYVSAGNRTGASETIFVKFTPTGGGVLNQGFFNDGTTRTITASDTKNRLVEKSSTGSTFRFSPNATDDAGVLLNSPALTPQDGVSVCYAATCDHNSPYANSYYDGYLEQAYTAGDWTTNSFGTNWFLGSTSGSASQIDAIIEAVAIYSVKKTDAEVLSNITEINRIVTSDTFLPMGLPNMVSGSLLGNIIDNADYQYGQRLVKFGADTVLMFSYTGEDGDYTNPGVGNQTLRKYTISTGTWGDLSVIYSDGATSYSRDNFPWINDDGTIFLFFLKWATSNQDGNASLMMMKSTNAVTFTTPVAILTGIASSPQISAVLNTADPTVKRLCLTSLNVVTKMDLVAASGSPVTGTTSTSALGINCAEGGYRNVGTGGNVIGILRVTAGDRLYMTTSPDYGATFTTAVNTGLGAASGTKVTPCLQLSAGDTGYVVASWNDRGNSNRLNLSPPTLIADALANKWQPGFIFQTMGNTRGNGSFCVLDNVARRYLLVEPQETADSPKQTDTHWFVIQDLRTDGSPGTNPAVASLPDPVAPSGRYWRNSFGRGYTKKERDDAERLERIRLGILDEERVAEVEQPVMPPEKKGASADEVADKVTRLLSSISRRNA